MSRDYKQEPSPIFLQERDRLLASASENLGRLIANVNILNRNIEAAALVGSQFGGVSRLWTQFERGLASSQEPSAPREQTGGAIANEQVADASIVPIEGAYAADVDVQATTLPFGRPPGGGTVGLPTVRES